MDISTISWFIETYPPTNLDEIIKTEEQLRITLPNIYKEFLLISNVAETNLASLYSIEALLEMNRTYEVQEYAPGYISVGNDHGGYHLLMKAEAGGEEFQLVSDGYGVPEDGNCVDNLKDWLNSQDGNPWRNEDEKQ